MKACEEEITDDLHVLLTGTALEGQLNPLFDETRKAIAGQNGISRRVASYLG